MGTPEDLHPDVPQLRAGGARLLRGSGGALLGGGHYWGGNPIWVGGPHSGGVRRCCGRGNPILGEGDPI